MNFFVLEYIQGVIMMKILAAFDSFKESMTAYAAGEAVQRAYNNVHICPLADGGEGTMEVMNRYLHGDIHEIEVAGPLFKTVHAKLAIMDDLAIIESAQACGLDYLTEEEKNGTEATSYGVGEMMKYAYDHGVKRFLLTLGGSACNDGGIGLLSGMGYAIVTGLNGKLVTGFDAVSRTVHLEEAIQKADIIFTGEGKMDHQTLYGKTPIGVLRLAQKYNKPVVAFCGKCEDKETLLEAGFEDVRCINHTDEPLSVLLEKGPQYLEEEVRRYLEEKNV